MNARCLDFYFDDIGDYVGGVYKTRFCSFIFNQQNEIIIIKKIIIVIT